MLITDGFWIYKRSWRDKLTVVEVVTNTIGLHGVDGKEVFIKRVYEIGFMNPMYLDEALKNGKFYQKIEMPKGEDDVAVQG